MYRAIYDYTSRLTNYMSFQKDDNFTVVDNTEKDWFLVQNGLGEVGYVPKNYVEPIHDEAMDVVQSIDGAIAAVHHQATCCGGTYTSQQRENLRKLIEHRTQVLQKDAAHLQQNTSLDYDHETVTSQGLSSSQFECVSKRKAPEPPDNEKRFSRSVKSVAAPHPPNRTSSLKSIDCSDSSSSDVQSHLNNYNATESLNTDSSSLPMTDNSTCVQTEIAEGTKNINLDLQNALPMLDVSNLHVPKNLGMELIEEIRRTTELSYDKSCLAVACLFSHLKLRIPETSDLVDKITLIFQQPADDAEEEISHDSVRLQELFSELTACKDDSQQRSWALHEDESLIKGYLEELNSIIENAKPSICRRAIAKHHFDGLNNLVVYYQMEVRLSLRLLMLKSFATICSLDKMAISQLLFSVLPFELASEMKNCKADVTHLSFVTLVLTMLFSTGETVQVSMYEHLNQSFIQFVFELLESPPSEEHEDKVSDLLVNLLLAFNLHFTNYEDNLVMPVLAKRGIAEIFCEKILILINRGEDPVQMFDYQPPSPNSVLKLLLDLYGNTKTACLFYTNDLKVLIDIIIRQLCDLSPGDKKRTLYLSLVQLILRNSDYSDNQHRKQELTKCFTNILTEETETELDKLIANEIMEEKKEMLFYS